MVQKRLEASSPGNYRVYFQAFFPETVAGFLPKRTRTPHLLLSRCKVTWSSKGGGLQNHAVRKFWPQAPSGVKTSLSPPPSDQNPGSTPEVHSKPVTEDVEKGSQSVERKLSASFLERLNLGQITFRSFHIRAKEVKMQRFFPEVQLAVFDNSAVCGEKSRLYRAAKNG